MPKDEDLELIQKALDTLGEYFDAVQIFATRHEESEGGTIRVSKGVGNYYARYGHIALWMQKQKDVDDEPDADE